MAATGTPTPNLGLRIPVGTDPASVDDINYNSNLLDTVLGAVGNTSVKDQLDELSDQIANISVGTNNTINSTAVASGSFKTLATITNVPSGQYLILADVDFGTDTNGVRILMIETSESSTNTAANCVAVQGRATLQKIRPFSLTPTDTIYVRAYQNSGSSINVTGLWRLIRLR